MKSLRGTVFLEPQSWTGTAGMYCTANKQKKADRYGLPFSLELISRTRHKIPGLLRIHRPIT